MGNWFGTEKEPPRPRYEASSILDFTPQRWSHQQQSVVVQSLRRPKVTPRERLPSSDYQWEYRSASVNKLYQPVTCVRRATRNHRGLISAVLNCNETLQWAPADYNQEVVHFFKLTSDSDEYQEISTLFKTTNQKRFKITSIDRIQNPYLMCAFLLKREEAKRRLGYYPEVRDLFHGTKRASVMSICEGNFDWRRHGVSVGVRFGKGVSFTPISNYATHYSDKESENKVMLVAKVLVGKECVGYKGMTLPTVDCDTTRKEDGHVIVKYEDNEFYPAYRITYDCTWEVQNRRKSKGNKNVSNIDMYYSDQLY